MRGGRELRREEAFVVAEFGKRKTRTTRKKREVGSFLELRRIEGES